jgi:hypothetical protein
MKPLHAIAGLCLLASCAKQPPAPAEELLSYQFSDSIYSYAGYFVDSNQQFHSFRYDSAFALNRSENILRNLSAARPYILFRQDSFWQTGDAALFRCVGPRHSNGDILELRFTGDSVQVYGQLEKWQTWTRSYLLHGAAAE